MWLINILPSLSILGTSTKPSLNTLQRVIPQLATEWNALGLELGAKGFTLVNIRVSNKDDPVKCCTDMLQNWLNGKQDCGNCPRTWNNFLPVVERVVGSEASTFIRKNILKWEEEREPMEQGTAESKCNQLLY